MLYILLYYINIIAFIVKVLYALVYNLLLKIIVPLLCLNAYHPFFYLVFFTSKLSDLIRQLISCNS